MPYYIFKIRPENNMEYIGEEEKYRDAKSRVRSIRAELPKEGDITCRMVHAASVAQGEKLLTVERDERIIGDD